VSGSTCIFCRIASGEIPAEVVHEDEHCVVFLDSAPLFPGHCLVCPKQHFDTLMDVPSPLLTPLFETAQAIARAVELGLGAEGSFVAINNKISQSVPHLHVHVIPRRRKDGMKGFFWPRRPYASDEERKQTGDLLRHALRNQPGLTS
jgi:histidine triad (HIT) family protein